MAKVKVKKAREHGSCFGVRRAIKIIDRAVKEYAEISTLGPIVHNRLVVTKLSEQASRSFTTLTRFRTESSLSPLMGPRRSYSRKFKTGRSM